MLGQTQIWLNSHGWINVEMSRYSVYKSAPVGIFSPKKETSMLSKYQKTHRKGVHIWVAPSDLFEIITILVQIYGSSSKIQVQKHRRQSTGSYCKMGWVRFTGSVKVEVKLLPTANQVKHRQNTDWSCAHDSCKLADRRPTAASKRKSLLRSGRCAHLRSGPQVDEGASNAGQTCDSNP